MKMQVSPEGKIAATHYRVLKTWGEDGKKRTLLQLNIEQGRTHQIRVHMAYIGLSVGLEIRYMGRTLMEKGLCCTHGVWLSGSRLPEKRSFWRQNFQSGAGERIIFDFFAAVCI